MRSDTTVIDLDDIDYSALATLEPGTTLAVNAMPHQIGSSKGTVFNGKLVTFQFYSDTILGWVRIDPDKSVTFL